MNDLRDHLGLDLRVAARQLLKDRGYLLTGGGNLALDFFERRALTDVFEEVVSYGHRGRSLDLEGTPQRVTA